MKKQEVIMDFTNPTTNKRGKLISKDVIVEFPLKASLYQVGDDMHLRFKENTKTYSFKLKEYSKNYSFKASVSELKEDKINIK